MKTKRPKIAQLAAVFVATGLLVGCGTGPNYVVDSTACGARNAVETPSTEKASVETKAPDAAAPENDAAEPTARFEKFVVAETFCVATNGRDLFNGQNLDGWTNETGAAPGSGWRVEDGLLRLAAPGDEGGDLLTKDEFQNYVLDFEFRFGKECNSGVKYKIVQPNGKGWVGLEYQIQDDANVEDGKIADRKIASLFDVLAASDSTKSPAAPTDAAPTGDFRQGRIVVFGKNVEHWLDGEKVLAFEIGSDAWNAAKNDSKYKIQQGFGEVDSSRILLQDHGYPVDFRNVKIRNLSGVAR